MSLNNKKCMGEESTNQANMHIKRANSIINTIDYIFLIKLCMFYKPKSITNSHNNTSLFRKKAT